MKEDNVEIQPGIMLKIKLNQFTKGSTVRIQVAVNKKVCNRTVNVYLAYDYQLVGITSVEELKYKNFPHSRENITRVDFTYSNDDGGTYYLVIANPERFRGERDLPEREAVVSYQIDIKTPEEKGSPLPLIIAVSSIGLVLFLVLLVLLKRKRAAQAYQQALYQTQYPPQVAFGTAVPPPGAYPTLSTPPAQPPPPTTPVPPQVAPGYTPEEYTPQYQPAQIPQTEEYPEVAESPQTPQYPSVPSPATPLPPDTSPAEEPAGAYTYTEEIPPETMPPPSYAPQPEPPEDVTEQVTEEHPPAPPEEETPKGEETTGAPPDKTGASQEE